MYGEPWSGVQVHLPQALATLSTLHDRGVSKIYFVGGEPFLSPILPELAQASRDRRIVNIVTSNGTILKAYRNESLMRNIDAVEFSVDSLDPDYLRMVGRLPNVDVMAQAIEETMRHGTEVRLITVVTRQNRSELPRLVEFAKRHGIRVMKIQPVYLPQDVPLYGRLALDAAEIAALRDFGRDIYEWTDDLERYFDYLCACADSRRRTHTCTAFASYLYIDAHGQVRRCPTLRTPMPEPSYADGPQSCSEMSLDCLSCYNLIEDFTFVLKA